MRITVVTWYVTILSCVLLTAAMAAVSPNELRCRCKPGQNYEGLELQHIMIVAVYPHNPYCNWQDTIAYLYGKKAWTCFDFSKLKTEIEKNMVSKTTREGITVYRRHFKETGIQVSESSQSLPTATVLGMPQPPVYFSSNASHATCQMQHNGESCSCSCT
ncbi:chemokine vCXCL12 [Aotine betaherpesvirus 1]|uniref:Chemokine vCXCL12 n=1 Tax=Aotine betaherpesvirus 1 TaxID=50290 RepID=G8XUJ1_9BETA|nr:chemokine vCXCL12 [Aotine betaherpesvirus 1]AEV80832.1 chemokine vCXCL12 [Aotine betaherpesvirus 1]